jgi:hypothetical protein
MIESCEPRNPDESLSDAGERRREAMLTQLLGQMAGMQARRVRRRRAAAAIVFGLVAVSAVLAPGRWPLPEARQIVNDSASADPESVGIVIVQTDAAILDRYRAIPSTITRWMKDDELLDALAVMGRRTGLIRVQGRTFLSDQMAMRR